MVVFGGLGALDFVRLALFAVTACFLPGFFIYSRGKKLGEAFGGDVIELVAASVTVSCCLLALAGVLVMFTVGFSFWSLALVEAVVIVLAWRLWKASFV